MLDRHNIGTFKCIFRTDLVVDFFDNAEKVEQKEEVWKVIKNMPEMPRDYEVYKIYFPVGSLYCSFNLQPIYMCKAEHSGHLYFFCDFDFLELVSTFVHPYEVINDVF